MLKMDEKNERITIVQQMHIQMESHIFRVVSLCLSCICPSIVPKTNVYGHYDRVVACSIHVWKQLERQSVL